jgi:hypothetical protein
MLKKEKARCSDRRGQLDRRSGSDKRTDEEKRLQGRSPDRCISKASASE